MCIFHPDGSFECDLGSLAPAEVELARKNFCKFDVDGDGSISKADFRAAMVQHADEWARPEKREQLDRMYANVDTSGTGVVRFAEFCVMRVRKASGASEGGASVLHRERKVRAFGRGEFGGPKPLLIPRRRNALRHPVPARHRFRRPLRYRAMSIRTA